MHDHHILTVEHMYKVDELALTHVEASFELMQNAAAVVCKEVLSELPEKAKVVVLCGTGNNGGDGFILAGLLMLQDIPVVTVFCGPSQALETLTGDALLAYQQFTDLSVGNAFLTLDDRQVETTESSDGIQQAIEDALANCHLIVDAVLGAGLSRPVSGQLAALFDAINQHQFNASPVVLSIDLPSGISGNTGRICGCALHADITVTFFRQKPAHLLYPGRAYCGEIRVRDIGIQPNVLEHIDIDLCENHPDMWLPGFPVPDHADHKYRRGHVLVQSGPAHATGAARLAAHAALRAGAGIVTMTSDADATQVNAAHLTEVMQRTISSDDAFEQCLQDNRFDCVVLGPGNGISPSLNNRVASALKACRHVVIDADAISAYSSIGHETPQSLFKLIKENPADVVLTPHEAEFERLFGNIETVTRHNDKVSRVRAAASCSGAIIVLKGADTVIADPRGCSFINTGTSPWLATAGSGDVLAGTIAALLAQYKLVEQRKWQATALNATCIAVWMHSRAATLAGPGLIASDLALQYSQVIQELLGMKAVF